MAPSVFDRRASSTDQELLMGTVMVRCPQTGRAISTGIETDAARFRQTAVFIGRSHCPHCRVKHEWFAGDAWVDERSQQMEDAD